MPHTWGATDGGSPRLARLVSLTMLEELLSIPLAEDADSGDGLSLPSEPASVQGSAAAVTHPALSPAPLLDTPAVCNHGPSQPWPLPWYRDAEPGLERSASSVSTSYQPQQPRVSAKFPTVILRSGPLGTPATVTFNEHVLGQVGPSTSSTSPFFPAPASSLSIQRHSVNSSSPEVHTVVSSGCRPASVLVSAGSSVSHYPTAVGFSKGRMASADSRGPLQPSTSEDNTATMLQTRKCQVCRKEMDQRSIRKYIRCKKVCNTCRSRLSVMRGGQEMRYCQLCSWFHNIGAFDDNRHSCKKALVRHNERRRNRTIAERAERENEKVARGANSL